MKVGRHDTDWSDSRAGQRVAGLFLHKFKHLLENFFIEPWVLLGCSGGSGGAGIGVQCGGASVRVYCGRANVGVG